MNKWLNSTNREAVCRALPDSWALACAESVPTFEQEPFLNAPDQHEQRVRLIPIVERSSASGNRDVTGRASCGSNWQLRAFPGDTCWCSDGFNCNERASSRERRRL